jgi:hypothetical protein
MIRKIRLAFTNRARARRLQQAASDFANEWADEMTLGDLAPRMGCMEAETLAGLLRAVGDDRAADVCIEQHATADDDEYDMHFVAPAPALTATP